MFFTHQPAPFIFTVAGMTITIIIIVVTKSDGAEGERSSADQPYAGKYCPFPHVIHLLPIYINTYSGFRRHPYWMLRIAETSASGQ